MKNYLIKAKGQLLDVNSDYYKQTKNKQISKLSQIQRILKIIIVL